MDIPALRESDGEAIATIKASLRSPALELTYELTQKDFYDSFVAHRERNISLKWCVRGLQVAFFLFLAIELLIFAIGHATGHETNYVSVIQTFLLAAFWAFLIWGTPWWAARTQFLQQPAAQGPRTMTLDGSGIHWQWKGGRTDVEWTNFIRFLESKTLFLVYNSPVCFNIVPKRVFALSERDSFRGLLQEKMAKPMAAHHKRIRPWVILFFVILGVASVPLVVVVIEIIRNLR